MQPIKKLSPTCMSNQYSARHCNRTILRVNSTRKREDLARMRVNSTRMRV
jgi:hypothetical protein